MALRAPAPDPMLDPFRDGTAVLRRDGRVAGHVATSVGSFWSPSRPLTRQWCVWFLVVWSDGTRERSVEDYPPWTYVKEMKRGVFDWVAGPGAPRAGVYEVEWLPLDRAREARERLKIGPADF